MEESVRLVGGDGPLFNFGSKPSRHHLVCFGSSGMSLLHFPCKFFHLQPFLCCQDLLGLTWVSSRVHLGLA